MIYCFSGTGNSLHAAHTLAGLLRERVIRITDETQPCPAWQGADEALGLVFPVYGWGMPRVVEHFIARLPQAGSDGARYVYAVLTCGDDIGRTDRLLRKALWQRGWRLQAVFSLQMRNTYVCLPGFDIDAPQTVEQKDSQARLRLQHIARCVGARGSSTPGDVMPGAFPWTKSYLLRPLFNRWLTSDRHFHCHAARCTGCGLCKRTCPLHNIALDPQAHTPRWQGRCTHCLGCYHCCPHHAIDYGFFSRHKGQVKIIG